MIKTKKIILTIGILFTVILSVIIIMVINMGKDISTYSEFNYNIDLAKIPDGTYTGSEDGGIVKASVEVIVVDHSITKVTLLSHDCGTGKPAEVIVNDMVIKNSLAVDAISGATYSSSIIKMAVYNALTK